MGGLWASLRRDCGAGSAGGAGFSGAIWLLAGIPLDFDWGGLGRGGARQHHFVAECTEEGEVGRADVTGGGGAGGGNFGGGGIVGNHHHADGGAGARRGAGVGGEPVGIVYDCLNDAVGFGDGGGDAGGGGDKNGMGDGVGGVGLGGMCLGGEVGGGDSFFGEDVYLGGTDVGVVDHGVWTDGEYFADLVVAGPAGLFEFISQDWHGGGSGGGGGDFGSAVADAFVDAFH